MNKTVTRILAIVGVLAVILFILFQVMMSRTKKASPEDLVQYTEGDRKIEVFYCQPAKKGREIFGGLVPYDQVWRTGANEASTFETSHDLSIGGEKLPAGKYTLWTIPGAQQWKVIFNSKMYGWGVNFSEEALREPEHDAVAIDVAVQPTGTTVERFTIKVDDAPTLGMSLAWDQTMVRVPLNWD
ncbi:MAG: DUF2911 domain-containing protein [Saprospiraceae bacterium]|nr:DUF2911 domain-containing protein [Saprospiraceae bacterium]